MFKSLTPFKTCLCVAVLFMLLVGLPLQSYAQEKSTLDVILQRGTIKVGMMLDLPPFCYRDSSGNPQGVWVEFAQELANGLGVKLEVVETPEPARIPALVAKKIDIQGGVPTCTLERMRAASFSIPIYLERFQAIVRTDSGIQKFSDLKGRTVATVRATTPEIYYLPYYETWKAADRKTKYISFESSGTALLALRQGRAEALVQTVPFLEEIQAKYPGEFRIVDPVYASGICGYVVRHGDVTWLNYVNNFLYYMVASGKAQTIFMKHGLPTEDIPPYFER